MCVRWRGELRLVVVSPEKVGRLGVALLGCRGGTMVRRRWKGVDMWVGGYKEEKEKNVKIRVGWRD